MSIELLPKYVLREVLSYLNLEDFCSLNRVNKSIHEKIKNLINENEKMKGLFILLKDPATCHLKDLAHCTKEIPVYKLASSYTFINSETQLMEKIPLFIHEKINSLSSLIKIDIFFPGIKPENNLCQIEHRLFSEIWIKTGKDKDPPYDILSKSEEKAFNARISLIFLENLNAVTIEDTTLGGSGTRRLEGYVIDFEIESYLRKSDNTEETHDLTSRIIKSVYLSSNRIIRALTKTHLPEIHAERKL